MENMFENSQVVVLYSAIVVQWYSACSATGLPDYSCEGHQQPRLPEQWKERESDKTVHRIKLIYNGKLKVQLSKDVIPNDPK